MWSETLGFRDHRPPYLDEFFEDVALRIPLSGREDLLDLGCGAGEVALGFAPYVGTLTGVELEPASVEEAWRRAERAGRAIRLVQSRVEEAPEDLGAYEVITIGTAYWFMHTPATLHRIDRWLRPGGCVILCLPRDDNVGREKWYEDFRRVQVGWARGNLFELMRLTPDQFFAGTDFAAVDRVDTFGQRPVDVEHLVNRALGYPSTSRAMLGAEADTMIDEIRAAMAPHFARGPRIERHCTSALIHRRRRDLRRPATR